MADTVESSEVVNVDETLKEKEVTVEETEPTETTVAEPEEKTTGEQNGSEKTADEPKENGTAKEENGTAPTESEGELKRKSIDVGDSNDVSEVTPDKKAKLEEKTEGKQDESVDSPAEQVAA